MLSMIAKEKTIIAREILDISELYGELRKLLAEFDVKIKRLEVITSHAASDYPALEKKASTFLNRKNSDMALP